MFIKQMYLNCLSQASYFISDGVEALVVDPKRDVDDYMTLAEERGVKIRHVVETHFHADFVSGHRELAERCGASIYFGESAKPQYDFVPLSDGEEIKLGSLILRALATPGHTPESICLLVIDCQKSSPDPSRWPGKPVSILTGDTLFVGGVGRPDLMGADLPQEVMAGQLYDSLHEKIMTLPDDVEVLPAHGPGSACGANLGSDTKSTIGKERATNYALRIEDRSEFVSTITQNIAAPPRYFRTDSSMNREGPRPLAEALSSLKGLSPAEFHEELSGHTKEVLVLDTRSADEFGRGHIPGSVNIGLGGRYASWVGTLIDESTALLLVSDSGKEVESAMRLARVGYENAIGFLDGGMDSWSNAKFETRTLAQIDVADLRARLDEFQVIDVRALGEWDGGHIEGAVHFALPELSQTPGDVLTVSKRPIAVICAGGYRSSIACSLLLKSGYEGPLINVRGGMSAWTGVGCPTVVPTN